MTLPTRLLFVVNDTPYFVLHWLERALAARGHGYDIHVAGGEGAAADTVRSMGLSFHKLRITRGRPSPLVDMASVSRLFQLYYTLRPDLVHHITIKPIIYGSVAARWLRVPAVVNTVPGLGYVFGAASWSATIQRQLVKQAYRFAFSHPNNRVIVENPDDLREIVGWRLVQPDQGVVIKGAGVDLDRFRPQTGEDRPEQVVFAGRLLWDKGVREFVEAARQSKIEFPNARFILVGVGDPGSPLSIPDSQLRLWEDSGIVEWWGRRDDMPNVLAKAAVVCLPSFYREGIPRVLIEAAACGRPIVTTDAPGCREIVRHGENGILVPPRNAAAVADAISQLLRSRALRDQMGFRGRAFAEAEFGTAHVVAQTLDVYRHLLSNLRVHA